VPDPRLFEERLVQKRSTGVKKAIRVILGIHRRPYTPPDDFDYAQIFADALNPGTIDLFLNGT
jgi:hypothetical protein